MRISWFFVRKVFNVDATVEITIILYIGERNIGRKKKIFGILSTTAAIVHVG